MSVADNVSMSVAAPAPVVVVKTKAEKEAAKLAAMSAERREAYLLAEQRAKEAKDDAKRIREEENKQKKLEKEQEKEKKKEQEKLEKKRSRDAESGDADKAPKKAKIEPKSRDELRADGLMKLYLDAASSEGFEGYDHGIARAVYTGAYLIDPRKNLPSEYKIIKEDQDVFSSHRLFLSTVPLDRLAKLVEALDIAAKRKNPLGIYKLYAEMAKDILRHLKSRELVEIVNETYVLKKGVTIDEDVWESAIGTAEDILESLDDGCDRHIRHHLSILRPAKEPKPKKDKPLTTEQIAVVSTAETRLAVLKKIAKRFDAFRGVAQLDEKSVLALDEIHEIVLKLKALPREIAETPNVADQGCSSPSSTVSIGSEPAAVQALVEREEHIDMEIGVMRSEYDMQLRQREDADMQAALAADADSADVNVDETEEDEEENKPAESNQDMTEVSEPAAEEPATKPKGDKKKARKSGAGRKASGGRKGKKVGS